MHEMGEKKRAQEQRIDEISVQRVKRKSQDKSAAHFPNAANARADEINELFWRFQAVESNHSGRLPHVPIQPGMIPSSRALLTRDKRLPLDTWNASGLQENVFGYQFSTFDSHRDYPQGIQSDDVQRDRGEVPQATGTGTVLTREDKQNRVTIPMPTSARRPSTIRSSILVNTYAHFKHV